MPHVAAIAKLGNVFPRVLRADVDMRSGNRTLEQRPEVLRAVGVDLAAHVLDRMVDHLLHRLGRDLDLEFGADFGQF